jgi:hypothetical protein
MGPYNLYPYVEKFPVQVIPVHRNLHPLPAGQDWRKGRTSPEKRISPEEIYPFTWNGPCEGLKKVYHPYGSS